MTDDNLCITGGCLCGAIRYEATRAPHSAGYCHCTMCQKGLGNLFGTFVSFRTTYFRYLSDKPTWYVCDDKIERGFCGTCGSPIAWQKPDTDYVVIWYGTLDDRETYMPEKHLWADTKLSWVDIQSHLPHEYGNCDEFSK